MTPDWLIVESRADDDIRAAYRWYEGERVGLGADFLDELRAAYLRIIDGPLRYPLVDSYVRRARLRRFPYGVFYEVVGERIIVFAVLHSGRDPATWQRRRG